MFGIRLGLEKLISTAGRSSIHQILIDKIRKELTLNKLLSTMYRRGSINSSHKKTIYLAKINDTVLDTRPTANSITPHALKTLYEG